MILFPLLAFALFYLSFRKSEPDSRLAFITAAVAWGICVEFITETLSVFHLIGKGPVAASWIVVCVTSVALYWRRGKKDSSAGEPWRKILGDRTQKLFFVGIGLVALLVGIAAVAAPPMTWDAMEYHLPRVNLWMSAHSVAFFATPDYRQIVFAPWAEYAMMQLHLLWGGDRLVNLVQWFAMIGCAVGVSLLAKLIGAGARGQLLAAVVSVTIPEGVLEASGPMNTYVATFWMLAAVIFFSLSNEKPERRYVVWAGAAAGLAVYTKGTAYVLLPGLMLGAWLAGNAEAKFRLMRRSLILFIPVLLLNAPQFIRNYQFANTPLGVPTPDHYAELEVAMKETTLGRTAANVIRNVSNHVGLRGSLNDRMDAIFRRAVTAIGQNPDDPAAIWGGTFHVNPLSNNEVVAGNPLHLFLLGGTLLYIFLCARKHEFRSAFWIAVGLFCSFGMLCAAMRWQMWSSRYHLPLFVAGAAISGVVLEKSCNKKYAAAIATLLLLVACAYAVANRSRSLLPVGPFTSVYAPREVLYFSDQHREIAAEQIAVARQIASSGCKNVAVDAYTPHEMAAILHSEASWYVYPLFAMLRADGEHRAIWYIGVHNLTTKYEERSPVGRECATICLQCRKVPEKWTVYSPMSEKTALVGDDIIFYKRQYLP